MDRFEAQLLLVINVDKTGCKTELMLIQGFSTARAYREYSLIFPKVR